MSYLWCDNRQLDSIFMFTAHKATEIFCGHVDDCVWEVDSVIWEKVRAVTVFSPFFYQALFFKAFVFNWGTFSRIALLSEVCCRYSRFLMHYELNIMHITLRKLYIKGYIASFSVRPCCKITRSRV